MTFLHFKLCFKYRLLIFFAIIIFFFFIYSQTRANGKQTKDFTEKAPLKNCQRSR